MSRSTVDADNVLEREAVSEAGNPFEGDAGATPHGEALETISRQMDAGEPLELPQSVQDFIHQPDLSAGARVVVSDPADPLIGLPDAGPMDGKTGTIIGPAREGGMMMVRFEDGTEGPVGVRSLSNPEPEPPAAPAPAATKPAAADAAQPARRETGATLRQAFTNQTGTMDAARLGDKLPRQVQTALDAGQKVTIYPDGKPVQITGVAGGMMLDAEGQRWCTLPLVMGKDLEAPALRIEPAAAPAEPTVAAVPAAAKVARPKAPAQPLPLVDQIIALGGIRREADSAGMTNTYVPGKGSLLPQRQGPTARPDSRAHRRTRLPDQ